MIENDKTPYPSKPSGPPKPSHIQSIARAFQLIDVLAELNREASITELSRKMGWPKSTTYGFLSTLRDYRYIEQSPITGHYKLGARFFEIGNIVSRSWEIQAAALPHMQKLNTSLGEVVQLAADDQGDVLYLGKVDSSHKLRMISKIGGRLPMHCTGLGKVLLAYHSNAEINSILTRKGMASMTPNTITEIPVLKKELETIRQQGFAVDNCESMEDLYCIAAPIFDETGHVKYAISVSVLYIEMTDAKREHITHMIKQCAQNISFDLGHRT